MTAQGPSPAAGDSEVSADVLAQTKAQLKSARIAAKAAKRNTKWIFWGGIVSALITLVGGYSIARFTQPDSAASAPAAKLALDPFETSSGNSNIGERVDLSGPVSGLKRGQLVWTFNQPHMKKSDKAVYPNTGPCLVTADRWKCPGVDVGGPLTATNKKNVLGKYLIWADVVSEQDASDIVAHLRCFPEGRLVPNNRGVKLEANRNCPQTYTDSTLPGSDIVAPQKITVTRTH